MTAVPVAAPRVLCGVATGGEAGPTPQSLAAADARRSTEPLGDRDAQRRALADAWSHGLSSGLIRPTTPRETC